MPMCKKVQIIQVWYISMPAKVLTRIPEKKIKYKLEITFKDLQYGHRTGRNTQDLIFIIRQLGEKLKKTFDTIKRGQYVWESLERRYMIENSEVLYKNNRNKIRSLNEQRFVIFCF